MRVIYKIIGNPGLCSLVVAFIGFVAAIIVAVIGARCSYHVASVSIQAERKRLIGFHKLEIYENAIEEINYLVPLYRQLWHEAYEKREPGELQAALPELQKTINSILEYQNRHNALGKAQVYSPALKDYVPFPVNSVCIKYIRDLEIFNQFANTHSSKDIEKFTDIPSDMYLIDELSKYEECADFLRQEIESLDFFEK